MQGEIKVGEVEATHLSSSSDFEQSKDEDDHKGDEEEEDGDFEFSFAGILPESGSSLAPADTIFSNGKILPSYPLFDRNLLLNDYEDSTINNNKNSNIKSAVRVPLRLFFIEEEKEQASFSSTSSNSSCLDDLEGVPSDSYCVWTPNDGKKNMKSNSTGTSSSSSSSGRWRMKDLMMGRSQSEGTIVKSKRGNKSFEKTTTMDQEQRKKKGSDRKSYLPYKPDIVGFFANVNLKGLPGNTHKPF